MAIKVDKRTNPLFIISQHDIIAPNVDGDSGYSSDDASQNDISRRLLSNITNGSESSLQPKQHSQPHSNQTKAMLVRIILLLVFVFMSIGMEIQSNSVQNEVTRLRSEVKQSTMNIELRRARRLERLQKNDDRVAFMHVLNSFQVPLESDLAGEMLVAYGGN
jgi:cell division protein FtsL